MIQIYFAGKGVIQARGELWKNFSKLCLATFDKSGKCSIFIEEKVTKTCNIRLICLAFFGSFGILPNEPM